ncbi:MAG TPA: cardiolipin synthase ClsB, partial [Cellvibrionaceae bacterium]
SLRHFPTMAGLFPAHMPIVREIKSHEKTEKGRSKDERLRKAYPESRHARRVTKQEEYETENES